MLSVGGRSSSESAARIDLLGVSGCCECRRIACFHQFLVVEPFRTAFDFRRRFANHT
jgi:hypothetical protein